MKLGKKIKLLKLIGIIFSVFVVALIISWFLLPKYLINYVEENDREWVNRDIGIQKLSLNLFTCSIEVEGLKITEPNFKDTFISVDQVFANFDAWPLLKSKIIAKEIKVTNLAGKIIQKGNTFNFSDLLDSRTEDSTGNTQETPTFVLNNISIAKSSIQYTDQILGNTLTLDSIHIEDKRFSSVDEVWDADIQIHQPEGGWIRGDVSYGLETNGYKVAAAIDSWDLSPFQPYVTSGIRLSDFGGLLNSDFQISGNTKGAGYIKSQGEITVSDFKMIDPENNPLVKVGKLFVGINAIDTQSNIYDFNEILIDNSHIKYEYLPNGDNFTKWLVGADTASTSDQDSSRSTTSNYYVSPFEMLSVYIYEMTKDFIFKSYSANTIKVSDFNLKFHDYTLEDPFHLDLAHLEVLSKNIKPESTHANFDVNGVINSTGKLKGGISVSRDGVKDMTVEVAISGLFLNRFSPYGRYYTAHHLQEGIASYTNKSTIKNSYLKSVNHLFVEKIKVGKKRKTNSGYSLPLRLAVAIIKDVDGNIDLEIPIEGPLNDPKYKFGKVIWQVVKNIFVKLATSPYRALSNAFSLNEKDLKNIYFNNAQIGLDKDQIKSLNSIAKVLQKKKEVTIRLEHLYNKDYEKDAIALNETKLLYFQQSGLPVKEDVPVRKQAVGISTYDPKFLEFVEKNTPAYDSILSIPENARRLLGEAKTEETLSSVIAKQQELVRDYLTNEKGIQENRFIIKDLSGDKRSFSQTKPKFEVQFNLTENQDTESKN